MFNRTHPCKTCPFRLEKPAVRFLGRERAEEIVDSLLDDKTFTCHSDLDKPEKDKQHCVGAMIILQAMDQPNQMMRICERIGAYDRTKLTGQDEVFEDFDAWVDCQEIDR